MDHLIDERNNRRPVLAFRLYFLILFAFLLYMAVPSDESKVLNNWTYGHDSIDMQQLAASRTNSETHLARMALHPIFKPLLGPLFRIGQKIGHFSNREGQQMLFRIMAALLGSLNLLFAALLFHRISPNTKMLLLFLALYAVSFSQWWFSVLFESYSLGNLFTSCLLFLLVKNQFAPESGSTLAFAAISSMLILVSWHNALLIGILLTYHFFVDQKNTHRWFRWLLYTFGLTIVLLLSILFLERISLQLVRDSITDTRNYLHSWSEMNFSNFLDHEKVTAVLTGFLFWSISPVLITLFPQAYYGSYAAWQNMPFMFISLIVFALFAGGCLQSIFRKETLLKPVIGLLVWLGSNMLFFIYYGPEISLFSLMSLLSWYGILYYGFLRWHWKGKYWIGLAFLIIVFVGNHMQLSTLTHCAECGVKK